MKQDFGRLYITQEELDNLNNKEITSKNRNGVVDFLNLI